MLTRCGLAAAVCAVAVSPAFAQAPAGADVVPTNAFAVVTLKIADLWDVNGEKARDELAASLRPTANTFVTAFGIQPVELERLTLFWPGPPVNPDLMVPFVVITTRKPYDAAKLGRAVQAASPRPTGVPDRPERAAKVDDILFLESRPFGVAFAAAYLLSDRSVLLVPKYEHDRDRAHQTVLIAQLLGRRPDGPLAEVLRRAGQHTLVAAARVDQAPWLLWEDGGNDFKPQYIPYRALLKAKTVEVAAGADPGTGVTVRLTFADPVDARAAEPVFRSLVRSAVGRLSTMRADVERDSILKEYAPLLAGIEKALAAVNLKVDGTVLAGEMNGVPGATLPKVGTVGATLARDWAERSKSQNNLRQIGLAIQNFHDVYRRLPADIVDRDGRPLLSWRVELLPFMEQERLFRQLDRTKPWDDPQNKAFLNRMPDQYQVPGRETKEKGLTCIQMFTAPQATKGSPLLVPGRKTTFAQVTDGLANTLMVVEAADPVEWLRPGDISFDPKKMPNVGWPERGLFRVLFCDASVREFRRSSLTDDTLRALITINGGEVFALPE